MTVFKTNSNTEKSKDLSPFSGAVSLSLFTESGEPIYVKGAGNPISIEVPMDPLMPIPDAEYTEPYIPPRPWEYMFYHTFDVTSARGSIHMQFRLENPGIQLLVLIKLGTFPNVTTGDFEFMCMIPHRMALAGMYKPVQNNIARFQ